MKSGAIVLLAALLLSSSSRSLNPAGALFVSAKVVTYKFVVTHGFWAPDCVQKVVYLINGEYPGPTIEVVEGDTVRAEVTNGLHVEGLSIHWHGIRQKGTNLMDGTSYVTQCPIPSGETFTYEFVADKAGTFFYHSHLSNQISHGLYGKLVVHERSNKPFPYTYDGEISLTLNDWWHRSLEEQLAGLDAIPFGWVGAPQSLLIDGHGKYNCSAVPAGNAVTGDVKACNDTNPQCSTNYYEVEHGKTYRLRIASVASLEMLNFAIESHTLKIVAADAYLVKPFDVSDLDIHAGQAVDVIFKADQAVGTYWIRSGIRGRKDGTPPALAVLHYKGATSSPPWSAPPPVHNATDTAYSIELLTKYHGWLKSSGGDVPDPPTKSTYRELILVGTQNKVNGQLKWAINNISLILPSTPYAHGLAVTPRVKYQTSFPPDKPKNPYDYSQPPPNYDALVGSRFYWFRKTGTIVDVVLQNANTLTAGNSDYHPWHLHGHQFWVIGHGLGIYDPKTDRQSFNLVDPPYRYTAEIVPYGWTAIRFVADNVGAWFFHCHIHPHAHMGMGVIFIVGNPKPLPKKTRKCGLLF